MRPNRGGLKLCGVYTVFFVMLMGLSFFSHDEGRILARALAMFPAGIALVTFPYLLGFPDLIRVDSWLNSVYVFYPLSLVIAYLVGWACSALMTLLKRLFIKQPPLPIGDDPPGFKPR